MSARKIAIGGGLLWGLAYVALMLCLQLPATAQRLTVIHSFNGSDGAGPSVGVTRDAAGNLYGTTYGGGNQHGTVFKLSHTNTGWVLTTLHVFNAIDGAGPAGRVLFGPDGALYGTTSYGGNGYGTVYRLQPPAVACPAVDCPWTETVLYAFQGGSDGWGPLGDLAFDQQGNIYGTTEQGGTGCGIGCGVVFELTRSGRSWSFSVLYAFLGDDDGSTPEGVILYAGNLFGSAHNGGRSRNGEVFRLAPSGSGWTKSAVYEFPNLMDGTAPSGGLAVGRFGTFYGTAQQGGQYGAGTVYALNYTSFQVLASLPYSPGNGPQAGVAIDSVGNLYGSAWSGDIFKLTHSGGNWILSELGSGPLGISGGVIVDGNGVVYGTSSTGGDYFEGYVFQIVQ